MNLWEYEEGYSFNDNDILEFGEIGNFYKELFKSEAVVKEDLLKFEWRLFEGDPEEEPDGYYFFDRVNGDSSFLMGEEEDDEEEQNYIEKEELMGLLGIKSIRTVKQEHVKKFLKDYDSWDVTRGNNGEISIWYSGPIIGDTIEQNDFTVEKLEETLTELMAELGD